MGLSHAAHLPELSELSVDRIAGAPSHLSRTWCVLSDRLPNPISFCFLLYRVRPATAAPNGGDERRDRALNPNYGDQDPSSAERAQLVASVFWKHCAFMFCIW